MMRVFYGDDRLRAQNAIEKILGENYEVFESENLDVGDMDSIFLGTSLFAENRKILVKDLGENKSCFAKLGDYASTPHEVVVWETKLDKRSVVYKDLVKQKIELKEFKLPEPVDKKQVFDVFEMAWRGNASGAVELCEKIEATNDPYMFFGLMISQALRKMDMGLSEKSKRALKILAEYDLKIKSTGIEPWILIKACLIKLSF